MTKLDEIAEEEHRLDGYRYRSAYDRRAIPPAKQEPEWISIPLATWRRLLHVQCAYDLLLSELNKGMCKQGTGQVPTWVIESLTKASGELS